MPTRLGLVASIVLSAAAFLACTQADSTSATESSAAIAASTADSGTGTVSLAEQGAKIVADHGCHGCHDSSAGVMAGNSAGVIRHVGSAGNVRIYAPNLTPDAKTGLGTAADGWTDAQIARAIRTGVDDECLTLCKVMPHFNLTDEEMTAVIAYLRSLPPVANEIANQGCPTVNASVSGAGTFVAADSTCTPPNATSSTNAPTR